MENVASSGSVKNRMVVVIENAHKPTFVQLRKNSIRKTTVLCVIQNELFVNHIRIVDTDRPE